jgi:radical SAM/Cys-rich protein
VVIIASLPCYHPENVNRQRGDGVFDKSIRALQELNSLGYGITIPLHLVYNPIDACLPPQQSELEANYKKSLKREFGIRFNQLFTITNQPIARFAKNLRQQGKYDEYMELLADSFNPNSVENLMCRSTLNVGLQGELYDCDFNQMLGMHFGNGKPTKLWDITPEHLDNQIIQTGDHCLACTAGSGSSCTGALS